MEKLFEIIHEDGDLLVIDKPAGLVCHPTKGDARSSLIGRVRLHLGSGTAHLVNRLDRETSGVVLVAKRDESARELRRIWGMRGVEKIYFAIVHGHVVADGGVIDAPLGKDEQSKSAIKDCVRSGGVPSLTEFSVEKRFSHAGKKFSLLRVMPRTGRKHQIRIHLAHIGHPIVGDKLYGGDEQIYLDFVQYRLTAEQKEKLILENHALHAADVRFHWHGKMISFRAEPGKWFSDFYK